ncbi:hypothetical protein VNI00_013565 [Paramarasmius palmivorus]|uniref:Uncharacterized protein n=1 Tax=Paramarasmius palmivorus TaxID=297713 RepID=A0AAW0BY93_9AGAR
MYSLLFLQDLRPKQVQRIGSIFAGSSTRTKAVVGLAALGAGWITWNSLFPRGLPVLPVNWKGACKSSNCTHPVDIILKSRDGEKFGAHTKNLELYNDSFPSVNSVVPNDEDVTLLEDAATIRLLLLFSHNAKRPNLELETLDTVFAFVQAADKYGNHGAFAACNLALR